MNRQMVYLLPEDAVGDPVMWLMDLVAAVETWRSRPGREPYAANPAAELIGAAELAADALEACEIGWLTTDDVAPLRHDPDPPRVAELRQAMAEYGEGVEDHRGMVVAVALELAETLDRCEVRVRPKGGREAPS